MMMLVTVSLPLPAIYAAAEAPDLPPGRAKAVAAFISFAAAAGAWLAQKDMAPKCQFWCWGHAQDTNI